MQSDLNLRSHVTDVVILYLQRLQEPRAAI